MLRQVSFSIWMPCCKNNLTLSYAADKNNGDNFDVAVDTNTSISRDFEEVNKYQKKGEQYLRDFHQNVVACLNSAFKRRSEKGAFLLCFVFLYSTSTCGKINVYVTGHTLDLDFVFTSF